MGSTIYSSIKATDIDAGVNGAVEYFLQPGGTKNLTFSGDKDSDPKFADGFGTFEIAYPHQGHVRRKTDNYLFILLNYEIHKI